MAKEIEEISTTTATKAKKLAEVELSAFVTATEPAFKLPSGDTVNLNQYLVWLGNTVLELKKAIG